MVFYHLSYTQVVLLMVETLHSMIDNIFSNNVNDEISSGNIYLTLSEHFSQFAFVKRRKLEPKEVDMYARDLHYLWFPWRPFHPKLEFPFIW